MFTKAMPRLVPGDAVAVVAPASPVHPDRLQAGVEAIEALGYHVLLGAHALGSDGLFSATDALRGEDLQQAWMSEAKAVFCARGGYGSQRLLNSFPWQAAMEAEPKWLIGYSDITALHNGFTLHGIPSIHGPIVEEFSAAGRSADVSALFRILAAGSPDVVSPCTHTKTRPLVGGEAQGKLVGGNLSLLAATLGTPAEVDTRGAILLLEEVSEAPYRVDRMLSSLSMAGKLGQATGFAVGTFTDCNPGEDGVPIEAVLRDWLEPLQKPAVVGLPIGHGGYNRPVVLGSWAKLDAERCTLEFSWQ